MQANKRVSQWQHSSMLSRGTHAYPGAYAGTTPVSRNRQSALRHWRATATSPIRLTRVPPLPQRSRHHPLRARSGCKRSPLHANSVVIQRTCRWPDLVIPCSRALAPLCYGVGVPPAQPPTARRFLHARQPKNAITHTQAPVLPIPVRSITGRTLSIRASVEACSGARRSAATAAICALRNVGWADTRRTRRRSPGGTGAPSHRRHASRGSGHFVRLVTRSP